VDCMAPLFRSAFVRGWGWVECGVGRGEPGVLADESKVSR
jgi:hypothetical protein